MAQPVNRLDALRTLRLANMDGAFVTAFLTLVSGSFLVGFIQYLGGSDLWIGYLTAVPAFLGLFQILGAIWGRSVRSYKRFVLPGGLIFRLLYLPFVVVPLFHMAGAPALFLLVFSVAVGAVAVQIVNPTYNEWISDMVPASSRGAFFGKRNAILSAFGAVAGLAGGLLLDAFTRLGEKESGFTLVFGIALICGLISMLFFFRMHDLERPVVVEVTLAETVRAMKSPLIDRNFRWVLLFFAVAVVGQTFAGNFFSAFALESLRMPFTIIQIAGFTHAAGAVLAARFWGGLADRYGNKPVLAILTFLIFITPVMWLFCFPGNEPWNSVILISGHVFSGVVWGGVAVVQFSLLLATSNAEDRANYIALGLALTAIIGGLAPMVGAVVMAELRASVLPLDVGYKVLFGISMLLRLVAVLFIIPIREEGATPVKKALKELTQVSPRGYRALRALSTSTDIAEREAALSEVGEKSFGLAADEVLKALHDPSPRLRRGAAAALPKLDAPGAVDALIHQLETHPDLVEEESIESLGSLRDPAAVPALVRYLDNPSPLLRRSAARALGKIGSHEAVGPLIEATTVPNDPDLRRASLQALRQLGAREAEPKIAEALFDPMPSVRIAAAEAVAELELVGCASNLRQTLDWFSDEASSELAYTLGVVGEKGDLPIILREARRASSAGTRRRCLLGMACLLDVESETYRLLLLQGIARDEALLALLSPGRTGGPGFEGALSLYSAGDESAALQALCKADESMPQEFAEEPVEELFLVSAAYVGRERRRA